LLLRQVIAYFASMPEMESPSRDRRNCRYDAVLFDLLTALLDSWSLWNAVAGDAESGRRWRAEYLRITYQTGAYRAYEDLVAEAAAVVGLRRGLAAELAARYSELQPWPGTQETLLALAAAGVSLGVVTNCSERLGRIAGSAASILRPDPGLVPRLFSWNWRYWFQIRRDFDVPRGYLDLAFPRAIAGLYELNSVLSRGNAHRRRRATNKGPVQLNVCSWCV
jgi:hypothetical protein